MADAPENRAILARVFVTQPEVDKLRAIAEKDGRTQAYHQREALRLYLAMFNDDGSPT